MKINNNDLKIALLQLFQSGFYSLVIVLVTLYSPLSFIAMSLRAGEWYVWERVIFALAWIIMWAIIFLDMPEIEIENYETEEEQEEF